MAMQDRKKTRIQLVLDFDGTITTEDTTAIIGAKCLQEAIKLAPAGLSQDQLPKPMSYYSEKYMQDLRAWKESQTEPEVGRQTVADEVSYLSRSRQVEIDSFLRVRQAVLSVPGGIREFEENDPLRNHFMIAAGREAVRSGDVKIRDYDALKEMIGWAEYEGCQWGIVSVSWSCHFIVGVLLEAGLIHGDEESITDVAAYIECNELLEPRHDAKRNYKGMICSAKDKQRAFKEIIHDWNAEYPGTSPVTIYVGDSSTDIGCLTEASIGLYICEDISTDPVVQTLRRLGIEVQPWKNHPPPESKTVYTIKGFDEALEWFNRDTE